MARLVVENIHQKDTLYNEIGLCAQSMSTILGQMINTIGRASTSPFNIKRFLHFDLLRLLHLNSNFET